MNRSVVVKARSGLAFTVVAGERFRVVDVAGEQVSDLVAFVRDDHSERLSQANTRKLIDPAVIILKMARRVST